MARGDSGTASRGARVETALKKLVDRLAGCRALRTSSIVIRAVGDGGRDYILDCSPSRVTVAAAPPPAPTLEIIVDSRSIEEVLGGRKDARKLFFAGVLRVRGDLRYLSDLAMELGILKQPL